MEDVLNLGQTRSVRFLDQFRLHVRTNGLSPRTESAYVYWAKRYIRFHRLQHPEKMPEQHVESFLGNLATHRNVSPATQRLALNALIFLYHCFFNRPFDELVFNYASNLQSFLLFFLQGRLNCFSVL